MTSRRTAFEGRIVRVTLEDAAMPDGSSVPFEVVHHPGGAAVVAVDEAGHVCLLRQYRHVVQDWLWELPAGKLEAHQTPLATARCELQEEAGLHASDWRDLGQVHSSPGIFTEVLHLFLARNLTPTDRSPEPGEVMEVHWLPLAEAISWAMSGQIADAKSIIGLVRAEAALATG